MNARDKYWRTPFHVASAQVIVLFVVCAHQVLVLVLVFLCSIKYFLLYQGAVECAKLLEPKISNINISDRYLARTKFYSVSLP